MSGKIDIIKLSKSPWKWRTWIAERIASLLDPHRFGIQALYLTGSSKNGSAAIASDIDIIIHFTGTEQQRSELLLWFEGWSLCLDEINFLMTGHRTGGLLDLHIITNEDILNKTSFAVKIDSKQDRAKPLKLMI